MINRPVALLNFLLLSQFRMAPSKRSYYRNILAKHFDFLHYRLPHALYIWLVYHRATYFIAPFHR